MSSRRPTLSESIERIARETGASDRFVDKVRTLFRGRGIDLERDAAPYVPALREAFRRHAEIRSNLEQARDSLERLHGHLAAMGESFQEQLRRIEAVRSALERQRARLARPADVPGTRKIDERWLVPGDNDLPIVPGPSDLH